MRAIMRCLHVIVLGSQPFGEEFAELNVIVDKKNLLHRRAQAPPT
jgi:hypothetical protein